MKEFPRLSSFFTKDPLTAKIGKHKIAIWGIRGDAYE
jgi:hypothetical protein